MISNKERLQKGLKEIEEMNKLKKDSHILKRIKKIIEEIDKKKGKKDKK